MRALSDILVAFVPMNLPYTMDVDQAAGAWHAFRPAFVYPYHYRDWDLDAFTASSPRPAAPTEVLRGPWYPAS